VLATPPVVFVNEFVASNSGGIVDETGQAEDWVELWNPNAFTVDLTGWHLTDDLANPTRWTFPALTIPPLGYALVWCDSDPNDGPLHATFGLSANGEVIGLSASAAFANAWVDTHAFGAQTTDVSEGRSPDGGAAWVSFLAPTPLATNSTGTAGVRVIPYGIGKLTSSSTLPALAWEGTPSATTNDFRIRVVDARPNSVGAPVQRRRTRRSAVRRRNTLGGGAVVARRHPFPRCARPHRVCNCGDAVRGRHDALPPILVPRLAAGRRHRRGTHVCAGSPLRSLNRSRTAHRRDDGAIGLRRIAAKTALIRASRLDPAIDGTVLAAAGPSPRKLPRSF
jgi:hypothetical protein